MYVNGELFSLNLSHFQNDREDEDDEEGSLKDFIDDAEDSDVVSGSDSDIQEVDESGEDVKRSTRQNKVGFTSGGDGRSTVNNPKIHAS